MSPVHTIQYSSPTGWWRRWTFDNMAREDLRTLVVSKKMLSVEVYADFKQRYCAAKLRVVNRATQVAAGVESLQRDMTLIFVTRVEDKLQVSTVHNSSSSLR